MALCSASICGSSVCNLSVIGRTSRISSVTFPAAKRDGSSVAERCNSSSKPMGIMCLLESMANG